MAALAELLTSLVRPAEHLPLIPERRRRRAPDAGVRAALLTLADLAAADEASDRPDAAELASRLRGAVGPERSRRTRPAPAPEERVPSLPDEPEGRAARAATMAAAIRPPAAVDEAARGPSAGTLLPRSTPTAEPPRPGRPRPLRPTRRTRVVALVMASAALAVVGVLAWDGGSDAAAPEAMPSSAPPTAAPDLSSPTPPSTTAAPAPSTAPATTGPAPCPDPAAAGPDVDGDGCPEPVGIDGARVTVEGTTWVVGRPEDRLAVADWDCDGRATVASVRPSTGEVFVFDRWPSPTDPLTVPAAVAVPGAVDLRVVDADGDGCASLVPVDAEGHDLGLPTASGATP